MAVFKCKMCGGDLEVTEGMKVIECDFCGTTQTVPTAKDENIQSLFNRANTLRMKSEFDKAEAIYEKIVQAKEDECEAYWGIILCRYGIEYVEDPKTFKRIPTCHRTSYDSVIADEDYKSAIKYADIVQRIVYENEAKEIDRIQREILELSQKEEPYDVFICYKETDSAGRRTVDSAIANDIYYQLTQEGYKVFYAAITLEDKLGSAYEPCIFAALNSAKVMLAIGTKPEYFNAVWVKNEWSRYLRLMKNDRTKLLIPCYKDMDAYELPDEFAHLQAQDMGKIGFINDVVRGIKKVIVKEEPKETVKETVVVNNSAPTGNADPLLERAFLFLEDGKWESADEYFEKVLDLEPKNAMAYLGKLCAELKVNSFEGLSDINLDFKEKDNFKKALRFADEDFKEKLEEQVVKQKERIAEEKCREEERLAEEKSRYEKEKEEAFKEAKELFKTAEKLSEFIKITDLLYEFKEETIVKNFLDEVNKKREPLTKETSKLLSNRIVCGGAYTVGLKSEGTVVAVGDNDEGQCNVSGWTDIVAISCGDVHTVGLKSDGTVVAVGDNEDGQCDVSGWENIVSVSTGFYHTVGLKSDGTVVAVGNNNDGQCDVSGWTDIVAISCEYENTIGIKSDGTILVTGKNRVDDEEYGENIIAISCGLDHIIGLLPNGKVVSSGTYLIYNSVKNESMPVKMNTSHWEDIVDIFCGGDCAIGLKANGTVVAMGQVSSEKCDTSRWENIANIFCGEHLVIGLKTDGTVEGSGLLDKWKSDMLLWKNIVSVSCGWDHTACLKSDGTVVTTDEDFDVTDWKLFEDIDKEIEKEKNRQKQINKRLLFEINKKKEEEKAQEEAARKAKIESLEKEKAALEAELPTIKGLFSGGKKAKVEARIAEIEKELQTLK